MIILKVFLSNGTIEVKVGSTYSAEKSIEMGIPQGSVIAPILFNILISDLPAHVSKNVDLVQYADDICMWTKVTMRKNATKRTLNYIKKSYQTDLNNVSAYMLQNGLFISKEKTHMVLFNPGFNPAQMPKFFIQDTCLEYKNTVKQTRAYLGHTQCN